MENKEKITSIINSIKNIAAKKLFSGEFTKRLISSFFILSFYSFFVLSPSYIYSFIVSMIIAACFQEAFGAIPADFDENQVKKWKLLMGSVLAMFALALLYLRSIDERGLLVWLVVVNVTADTAAYVIGKIFGVKKLAPSISPNKTLEGLMGALTATSVVSLFFYYSVSSVVPGLTFLRFLLFAAFMGLTSQASDLMQSKVKRIFKIKDSGSLIPGHGGVLDRLDSWILSSIVLALVVALS